MVFLGTSFRFFGANPENLPHLSAETTATSVGYGSGDSEQRSSELGMASQWSCPPVATHKPLFQPLFPRGNKGHTFPERQ